MDKIEVKPFWKSVSFWITLLTIVSLVVDQLVAGGVIPAGGWAAIVGSVAALVVKRGLTENTAIKANALVEASKADPQKPPQG